MRALALVDGEHYPEVVRAAFAELPHEVVGAVILGGGEKLREPPDYGVPLHADLAEGLETAGADVVVDLSDEPVVGPRTRFLYLIHYLGLPQASARWRAIVGPAC